MAGKINVPVSVAVQGVANTAKQFQVLGGSISKVGRTAGLAAAGFAVFAGAVRAADFAQNAIAGARDLERNLLGLKSVFQEVTPQMVQFSKDAQAVGLSLNDASKASTFIGSVLKQSGYSIQETADLTERLVKLGTDLSLTYGYDVQEALMGMTALFRGEYDPIEKFGVAMKQSEINSELAARGMDNLEGAARRFAEQQIRVELLFQRSQSAQGAFERGTGTLAVEQLKLAAAFDNLQNTVAVSMLPVLGEIFQDLQVSVEKLRPALTEAFEAAAPALQNMAEVLLPLISDGFVTVIEGITTFLGIVERLFDPTTELGEAFAEVAATVESLANLINTSLGAYGFDTIGSFEQLLIAISDIANEILRTFEAVVITISVMTQAAMAFVDADPDNFLSTDWNAKITGMMAVRDAYVANQVAVRQFNKELADQERILDRANTAWSNSWIARGEWAKKQGLIPTVAPVSTGGAGDKKNEQKAKDYVKDFFAKIKEEVAKQQARLKLEKLGASEGLIDQILGSQGWEKVFKKVLASGTAGLRKLQNEFNRTAAGIKELDAARSAAQDQIDEAVRKAQAEAERLWEAYEAAKEKAEEFKRSMKEIATLNILPTVDVELGKFESQIVDTFEAIRDKLEDGLYDKAIFQEDYDILMAYVATEEQALRKLSADRDDLAKRKELAQAIISEYRSALTASLSLTSLLNNVKEETETKTVTETTSGILRLGKSLREFGVSVTRQFEQAVSQTKNKTETVLSGFREMADKARTFGENLRKLRALGLDDQLFNQLIQAGVEAGGETAQALVDGGSATINEVNTLFREIDALGADLGEEVAATLYGTGIDMANGLIEGISSKQSELEQLARSMAEAFNREFAAKVSIAVQAPVTAAQQVAQTAQDAVTKTQGINMADLQILNKWIADASRYIANVGDETKKAGAELKKSIYEQLRDAVLSGTDIDMTTFSPGMGSAELLAAVQKENPGVVNNININVKTDATQSTAMVGKTLGTIITSYVQTGGQVAV